MKPFCFRGGSWCCLCRYPLLMILFFITEEGALSSNIWVEREGVKRSATHLSKNLLSLSSLRSIRSNLAYQNLGSLTIMANGYCFTFKFRFNDPIAVWLISFWVLFVLFPICLINDPQLAEGKGITTFKRPVAWWYTFVITDLLIFCKTSNIADNWNHLKLEIEMGTGIIAL